MRREHMAANMPPSSRKPTRSGGYPGSIEQHGRVENSLCGVAPRRREARAALDDGLANGSLLSLRSAGMTAAYRTVPPQAGKLAARSVPVPARGPRYAA